MSSNSNADASVLLAAERARFAAANPRSAALAAETKKHWLHGVPLHWMADWGTPFPLFVAQAQGNRLTDVDGHTYTDFCLGDTGAMFGHSPAPVMEAIARQLSRGLTTMLPSEDSGPVGRLLTERFGLPFWQVIDRAVIRWARGLTGRRKVLVFNGCYHGAVDDAFVALENGVPRNRSGLIGQVQDLTATSVVIEFNDLDALAKALATRQIACVLAEPVMTNCAMVLPDPGYHAELRRLTRETGTLLIIDETHTISSSASGYTGAHGLEPDMFVLGKPIAGGIPCAVYGWTAKVDRTMQKLLSFKDTGYSGIGTTLSGSPLQLAAMRAVLEHVLTPATYAAATPIADYLETGIAALIAKHALAWSVLRVGLRAELLTVPVPPRNGSEANLIAHGPVEQALHLYCLNRGVLITPFHSMLLVSPATARDDITHLLHILEGAFAALIRGSAP
jgi:glutamate-1-semialdehyde 2,1-aminomutase